MISANDALNSIEKAASSVRRDEDRLVQTMKSASEEATRLRTDQAGQFRALAKFRLDALQQKQISGDLDAAESRAVAALGELDKRLASIESERKSLDSNITVAQADRETRAKAVAAAKDAVNTLEAATYQRLSGDVDWQSQSARVTGAASRAAAAEEKAVQSEKDRDEKSKPYLADELFVYLWQRGYGTSAYHGGIWARWGDSFVARVVSYEEARQNYYTLTEIPKRLREHADRLKADAESEKAGLVTFERKATETDGIEKLERAEETATAALDAARKKVRELEDSRAALDTQRAALVDGGGKGGMQGIVDDLANSLAREDLRDLLRQALITPSPEDENIVGALQKIEANLAGLQKQIDDARKASVELARKRAELERAQDDFVRAGYDRRGGDFNNEQLIGSIIGGIIGGMLSSRDLNDALRSGYRERRRPSNFNIDIGGGGPWGGGGRGGFGGGGGGGGGFRTGGGF